MKKFIIEGEFWDLFPKAKIGVIVFNGIDNSIKGKEMYEELILAAEKEAMTHLAARISAMR